MEENKNFPGALEDTRTDEQKSKDFYHEEIASAGPMPVWQEKKLSDFANLFPIRNQDGSSSCVAQTLALILGIENKREEGRFIEFSAKDIYTRRSNIDSGGMIGVEALEIGRKYGATLETFIPSQNQNESQMNIIERKISDFQLSQIFKSGGYVQHQVFDIEAIATVMEQYRKNGIARPFMTWYLFPRAEWDSQPDLTESQTDIVHHSVTAVDYCTINGVKGLVTQDSWGLDWTTDRGLRFITEDYLKKRMTFCAYILDLSNAWRDVPNIPEVPKPHVILTQTLKMGSRGDEVKQLQSVLRYEELFPQITPMEGIFGAITDKGVRAFQEKHLLANDGIVGRNTRDFINSNYK